MAFVVYGSLVPLNWTPVPFDTAVSQLLRAPMLKLGVQHRADWVANGVLYLPVGFLTAAALLGPHRDAGRKLLAASAAAMFSAVLAVAVEFTQVFFPPRTVSRNDMLAEAIGGTLGALAALGGTQALRALLQGFSAGGAVLLRRLFWAYCGLYGLLALFPFDLLLSGAEWQQKLLSPNVGWLLAGTPDAPLARRGASLLLEVLAVLPMGAWWAAQRQRSGRAAPPASAALIGAAIGLAIELAQLGIASGVSQGVSMLTRAGGFALGAAAWSQAGALHIETWRAGLRRTTAPLLALYLPALTWVNGWWQGPWLDLNGALHRLRFEQHFMPFYYHYYTTEMQAVVSLTSVAASYVPLGLVGWAWHASPLGAGCAALLLGLVLEVVKLWVPPGHPDPTNLLIAALTAWAVPQLIARLSRPDTVPRR